MSEIECFSLNSGLIEQELGPDRGIVTYGHDAAGQTVSRTDGRGLRQEADYDAGGRLTAERWPAESRQRTYQYDTCPNGMGRLCGITDGPDSASFAYDGFGRLASETRQAGTQAPLTAGYAWDTGDRLSTLTYPGGRIVQFQRDALGRLTGILSDGVAIVEARQVRPDGALLSQRYGNGLTETRTYDLQGRLAMWSIPGVLSRTYGRDANGNRLCDARGVHA